MTGDKYGKSENMFQEMNRRNKYRGIPNKSVLWEYIM